MTYARGTSVPVERSQVELERLLAQHGATQFYRGTTEDRAVVGFRLNDRIVKLSIPMSKAADFKGRGQEKAAQLAREKWRALLLSVKAKLVGVAAGVESFEEAFLAHVVTPTGKTVYEETGDKLRMAYTTGKMPLLLPGMGETR